MFTGAGAGAGGTGSGGSALFCCGAWIRLVGASSPVEESMIHRRNISKVNKATHGGGNITGSESEYDSTCCGIFVPDIFRYLLVRTHHTTKVPTFEPLSVTSNLNDLLLEKGNFWG